MSPNPGRLARNMSTLLPFLYQTRTLQRALQTPLFHLRALHVSAAYHARRPPHKGGRSADDSVPFEFAPDQTAHATSRRRRNPESTITESEQRVFDEIFGAISQRRKQLGGGAIIPGAESQLHDGIPGEATELDKDGQELNREAILAMYPSALRQAAEIALGLQAEEDKDARVVSEGPDDATALNETDAEILRKQEASKAAERAALLSLHKAEKARIQSVLQACTSDTAVWAVLEDQVFSMVERLGIGSPAPTAPKREAKAAAATKPEPLKMEQYGPLYSVHLLTALRHLDRGFATPSPLALNVLPRIMELGMASYVLGVSTRFYNELMSIFWHRHGDADAVMRLLKEMERAGLSPDGQTLKIVEAVTVAVEGLAGAERNPFADVLSSTQEFDSVVLAKLASRRRWVLASMEERADALPF